MKALTIVRVVLWGFVGLFALAVGATALGFYFDDKGAFSLTDQTGRRVTEQEFRGKPTLVFFGFTHCPDVCPTALYEATGWFEALGDKADKLNMMFVSVDPERDTPEALKDYLSSFHPRIRAVTGTPEEIADVAKAYNAVYMKVPLPEGGYTINHQASVFMTDARGRIVGTISPQESKENALAKLRRLIG